MSKKISRRSFVDKTAKSAAAFTIVPSFAVSGLGHKAPSDKLNIAAIGIGGMGSSNLKQMEAENIVALCDVDWGYSAPVFERYSNAKQYWDWRKMFDEISDEFDAVLVATADHTHAIIASHAMTLGKHVYVQKPLTHSIYESRLLSRLADKYKVATSMGNQGSSGDGVREICAWIWNGEVGEIKKVDTWTNRPIWPQGLNKPEKIDDIPETLNWDLFIGTAKMRDFNAIYTPWNWRGWWDFGTGAFGDMACHIMHPAFAALNLGYPSTVNGSSSMLLNDCAPTSQMVTMTFPERKGMGMYDSFGELDLTWYDGGLTPPIPEGWPEGKSMNMFGGGVMFHGSEDTLVAGCYGRAPFFLSGKKPEVKTDLRVVENSHEEDWIRACKESPENRVPTKSAFNEAGPFNEIVLMGVLAVRLQGLNKILEWDGENMMFTNISDSDEVRFVESDNFAMVDGKPKFDRKMTDRLNAKELAEELIKHTYRDGWSLPDMPVKTS